MNGIKTILVIMGCVVTVASLDAAYRGKQQTNTNRMQETIQDIQYEFSNHEEEIRMLSSQLENQSAELDELRSLAQDSAHAAQNQLPDQIAKVEKRVAGMEGDVKNALSDLRKLQTHANDTAKVLDQFQKRVVAMESQLEHQKAALASILKALNVEVDGPSNQYTVKSGDTLGGIAQKHKTSIQAIKNRNQLKNSTIFPGQVLELPEGR